MCIRDSGNIGLILGVLCLTLVVRYNQDNIYGGSSLMQGLRVLAEGQVDGKKAACDGVDFNASGRTQNTSSAITARIQSIRGTNKLKELLSRDKPADGVNDYANSLYGAILPWIIGLALLTIGHWYCMCCCCCEYLWQTCCKSMFRDYEKNPVTQSEKIRYVIVVVGFGIILSGFAIAGLVINGNQKAGAKQTVCGAFTMISDFRTGTTVQVKGANLSWIGLQPAFDKLKTIEDAVRNAPNSMTSNVDSSTSGIDSDYNNIVSKLTGIVNSNQGKQLSNPDPTNNDGALVNSDAITNLGPLTSSTTFTGALKLELDTKYNLTKTATSQISSYSKTIKTQADSIANSIAAVRAPFKDFIATFDNTYNSASNSINSINDVLSYIYSFFAAVLGIYIFFFFVIIITYLIIQAAKNPSLCICLHCDWWYLNAFLSFGFILALILTPLSYVALESCDIINTVLADPNSLNTYGKGDVLDKDISDKIRICIGGSGDLLSNFDTGGQLSQLSSFTTNLDQITQLQNNLTNPNVPDSYVMPDVRRIINGYVQGYYPAFTSDPSNIANDRANKAVLALTSWADASAPGSQQGSMGSCSVTKDAWFLSQANCTAPNVNISKSSPKANFGSPSCAGIKEWDTTAATSRYDSSSFSSCKNLAPPFSNFQTTDNIIRSYVSSLRKYQDSVESVFSPVLTDLDAVSSLNAQFRQGLLKITQPIFDLKNQVQGLVDQVSNSKKTGILDQVNCAFVGVQLYAITDSFCDVFINAIFTLSWLIGVCSFLGLFVSISTFCLGYRISKEARKSNINNKIMDAETPNAYPPEQQNYMPVDQHPQQY
eukprot:TRINITY_DN1080_c0_g1_i1.p1 TRINITY_DN1080_c0_g1~~TRINITY_DN1080_c0_g1_i1.p1  ORF type:complete len:848 (+),score=159.93 TRINITY_DN1080_c0_g1_i1:68-2545(+)